MSVLALWTIIALVSERKGKWEGEEREREREAT